MEHLSGLPALPVAVPLLVAGFTAATRQFIPGRVLNVLAILTAAFVAAVCALLFAESLHGPVVYWFGGWQPFAHAALGIAFVVDPMGAVFATLASSLFLAALLFSSKYFDDLRALYHVLMLTFLAAMCGFCLTGDLFNLFVYFELMSTCGVALCAYRTEWPGPVQGALNFGITNTVGGLLILSGIGLLYGRTGALNMAQIGLALQNAGRGPLVTIAFLLIVSGFFVKAGVAPFHGWVPDAHAVAPTPVCILFSGVMDQLGIYGLARVYWTVFAGVPGHPPSLTNILVGAGTITAVVGATMCAAQRSFKRLLAFSTISHVGIMLAGFALFDRLSTAGAAIYVMGHAMFKGALFCCSGILLHRFSTEDEYKLQGRARRPDFRLGLTAGLLVVGALGLAGLPPLGLFRGESLIDKAARLNGYSWLPWIAIMSAAVTGGAVLRFTGRTFLGWGPEVPGREPRPSGFDPDGGDEAKPETKGGRNQISWVMLTAPAILLAVGVFLGIMGGVVPAMGRAAWLFQNHQLYVSSVLGLPAGSSAAAPGPLQEPGSVWEGVVSAGLAIGLALIALRTPDPMRDRLVRGWRAAVHPLRLAQTGHPGDYVTWITFGAAALGVLFVRYL